MSQVFNGQSLLQIKVNTGLNLASATVVKILYKRPDGVSGEFVATGATGTELYYNVQATDVVVYGVWEMQSYVEIGGKKGYGEIFTIAFDKNLK